LLILLSRLIALILLSFWNTLISFTQVSSESLVVVIHGLIEVLTDTILLRRKSRLTWAVSWLVVVSIFEGIVLEV